MQRPVGLLLLLLGTMFILTCTRSADVDPEVSGESELRQPEGPDAGNGLTLTPAGEQRAAQPEPPLPVVDPRETAFERSRALSSALYPQDYYIGLFGPPVGAFDRQLWELAHGLLSASSASQISVARHDEEALEVARSAARVNQTVRLSPPERLASGEYSLLFRAGSSDGVIGELILALERGRWYTAGIQWQPTTDADQVYAPGASRSRLVW